MKHLSGSIITCGLMVTLITTLAAQDNYQITGYILDSETGDPVPYASIGVPQQEKGISSNINGFFRLLLPENNPNHHLQISSIGYRRLIIPFSQITWDQDQQFQLVPETRLLDEIVILGRPQSLEEMVKSAAKNRRIYLRSNPYLMNGFYRERLTIDGTVVGFTEGQGILYMNGYDPRYKNNSSHLSYDLMQWKHLRRSDYPDSLAKYLELAALFKAKDYYLHDGPLEKRNLDRLHYTVTDSTSYQDRLVMEISFEPTQDYTDRIPYKGKMFVKEDDQALIRLEIETDGAEPFLRVSSYEQQIRGKFQLSFVQFEGQYYLGQTSYSRTFTHHGQRVEWHMELIGASFSNQKAMFLNQNQRTVLYSEMLNPLIYYDPEFWQDFSYAGQFDFIDTETRTQFQQHHDLRLVPLPEGFQNYEQMANDRGALDFIMQR